MVDTVQHCMVVPDDYRLMINLFFEHYFGYSIHIGFNVRC